MRRLERVIPILLAGAVGLTACTGQNAGEEQAPATATLAPIVSMTPRYTATPQPTRTPIPTFTFTPSITPTPTDVPPSPTPTEKPPTIGIVNSLQAINVREGPGVTYNAFVAIKPGTGVEVINQSPGGDWYNIRLDDGREGWVSANLLRLESTPTPLPTSTPTPNLTAIALGTPLPTALLGEGTVTPTPPRSISTPTPITLQLEPSSTGGAPAATRTPTLQSTTAPGVPVIDFSAINQTATALAGGIFEPSTTPAPFVTPTLVETSAPAETSAGPASATVGPPPPVNTLPPGTAQVGEGTAVFALCNDASQGIPAPADLAAGSTIRIWWAWFAKTPDQIQNHLDHSTYEVRLDGILLTNLSLYRTGIIERPGDDVVYWYVPAGPLASGEHQITYRVTWDQTITDGYQNFGPGTNSSVEEGGCTFVVH